MTTAELPKYELYVAGGSFPPANGRFYVMKRFAARFDVCGGALEGSPFKLPSTSRSW